jgi:hypothetical protein
MHTSSCLAMYLRAYKKEPLMLISILNGGLISMLAIRLIPLDSDYGAVIAYSLPNLLTALVCAIIFLKTLRKHK